MPSPLKKITTRAKQIYKKGGTWKGAIKKAGAEYRAGKISGVRKKKKTTRRKRKSGSKIRRKKIGALNANQRLNLSRAKSFHRQEGGFIDAIGSVSHHKSQAKIGLKQQLSKKAGRRELATTKTERKKLSKDIAKIKRDIRALC